MAAVAAKNTAPEILVRKLLHGLGYRFRLHVKGLPGSPDIVLPKWRSVVFVNGCFWHGHSCARGNAPTSNVEFWQRKIGKNRERDSRARRELRKCGWRVVTIWQCETKDSTRLRKRMVQFLSL
jgi:DNA mismatch endonuclease (patch repair protein)